MSRFILVIQSTNSHVRAALVTRELRVASSAHQVYQVIDASREFDPLEVWYKTKQVIAACLDIGRTQPREILGIALVGQEREMLIWYEEGLEIIARGIQFSDGNSFDQPGLTWRDKKGKPNVYCGTMTTWLLWNLTGEYVTTADGGRATVGGGEVAQPKFCESTDVECFGKSRVRAPLNAELPVAAFVRGNAGGDEVVVEASKIAFGNLGVNK